MTDATIKFNSIDLLTQLREAGFSDEQAEVQARAFDALEAQIVGQLVTHAELQHELKVLELRLTVRMGAMTATTIAVLGTLIALF